MTTENRYWKTVSEKRLKRRRALAIAAGAATGTALLAACGGDGTPGETGSGLLTKPGDTTKEAKVGGTYVWPQTAEVQTFDPFFTSAPTQTHANIVYNRLVRIKPGYLEAARPEVLTGDIVESWEFSPDKRQLTMKLQPKAVWHDLQPVGGRPVDAEDIAFSWKQLEARGTNRSVFAGSVNPAAPVESVTAVDNKTFVIKTNQAYAPLLGLFAYTSVGSMWAVPRESEGKFDIRRQMIGSAHYVQTDHQTSLRSTYKRNPNYWDTGRTFIETIQRPLIAEYAAGLAQFKSGQTHEWAVRSEDILTTKQDAPALNIYADELIDNTTVSMFGWNPAFGDRTPFRDKRLRQAFSMAWDREQWLDVRFNVSGFRDAGLPIETFWSTSLHPRDQGWWLDPKGKEFGPNARYYHQNIAEAKKLLSAAGYANGIDVDAHYVTTGQYGVNFNNDVAIIIGFAAEAGIRIKTDPVNWNTDWRPKYADSLGDYEGMSFRGSPEFHPDPAERAFAAYHPQGGQLYTGFFSDDSSFQKGDPRLTAILEKTRQEFDAKKRIELMHDFQRIEAEGMYRPRLPGNATTFSMRWPSLRNFGVFKTEMPMLSVWLDEEKPPFKRT